jgi:hypothetical protein
MFRGAAGAVIGEANGLASMVSKTSRVASSSNGSHSL